MNFMLCSLTIILISQIIFVDNMIEWPKDNYGVPKPFLGCPKGIESDDHIVLWPGSNYKYTTTSNVVFKDSTDELSMHICYKSFPGNPDIGSLMSGSFCLIKLNNKNCPSKLVQSTIELKENNKVLHYLKFCCRQDNINKSEAFPNRGPFFLFRNKDKCQEAHMYKIRDAEIDVRIIGISSLSINTIGAIGFSPDLAVNLENKSFKIRLCYYYLLKDESINNKVDQRDKRFRNFQNDFNEQLNQNDLNNNKIDQNILKDPIDQTVIKGQIGQSVEDAQKEEYERKEKEAKDKIIKILKIVGFTFLGIVLFGLLITGIILILICYKIGPFKKS